MRRIDVGALDLGDVAQPKEAAALPEIDRLEALFRREFARDANGDALRPRIDDAAWQSQRSGPAASASSALMSRAKRRELMGRKLEIDLLILRADEIHLGDIGHAQQFGPHPIDMVSQLAR